MLRKKIKDLREAGATLLNAAARRAVTTMLAARGETPAAFGRRCIPSGCVAPRSNTPGIAPHRAQDARWGPRSALVAPFRRGPHGADCAPWGGGGRIAGLGATLDFHHGLLTIRAWSATVPSSLDGPERAKGWASAFDR